MRACVIKGGGSHGAWGAGVLTRLNRDYDMVLGVSTGALMATHVYLKEFDLLKIAYTSVTTKDIFNVNPVLPNGNVNIPNFIWRLIRGKKTLGESQGLKNQIDKVLTESLFLRSQKGLVMVGVQNITAVPYRVEHKSNQLLDFESFKKWVWASASYPLLGTIIEDNGMEYEDGGISESLSLKKAIELGATEIDVFIHDTKISAGKQDRINNIPHNFLRIFNIGRAAVDKKDIVEGLEMARLKKCKVNIFYMKDDTTLNAAVFDKTQMLELWNAGFTGRYVMDNYDYSVSPAIESIR